MVPFRELFPRFTERDGMVIFCVTKEVMRSEGMGPESSQVERSKTIEFELIHSSPPSSCAGIDPPSGLLAALK